MQALYYLRHTPSLKGVGEIELYISSSVTVA
jgi:hypothetical protein